MVRKKRKAGDQCEQCSGTGTMCLNCMSSLDDCECGENSEPIRCDICDGRDTLDEFAADCGNSFDTSTEGGE